MTDIYEVMQLYTAYLAEEVMDMTGLNITETLDQLEEGTKNKRIIRTEISTIILWTKV